MTTKKRRTTKKVVAVEAVVDHDGHDVLEEVVVKQLPQLYQSTIFASSGPYEPKDVVGHIQFSDTTGLMSVVCRNSKYDSDLDVLVQSAIILKDTPSVMFSAHTKAWLLNIHKAVLHRHWTASEALNKDEI